MCCLTENREDGVNPSRTRRCIRGQTLHDASQPLSGNRWEGAVSRPIRKPEDLPVGRIAANALTRQTTLLPPTLI